MIVLTVGGFRLLDVEELRVIPYVQDTRPKESGWKPVENYGWTNSIAENKWRWAVAALTGVTRSSAIQISRICKTWEEADAIFKGFAKSLQPTYFYDENMERKAEKVECTSKAKALPKTAEAPNVVSQPEKDAVVTAAEG